MSGPCYGMVLFVWALSVKIRWVSWPKLCTLLWCLGLVRVTIFLVWAVCGYILCVFWALFVRFLLCLGLPCVVSFFVWALFVYNSMPWGPDTTGLYKNKPRHKSNPHKQGLEQKGPCSEPQKYVYRERAQTPKGAHTTQESIQRKPSV